MQKFSTNAAIILLGATILLVLAFSTDTARADRFDQVFGQKKGNAGKLCAHGARTCMARCRAIAHSNTGKANSPEREKYCWDEHCRSILKSNGC
jgi:hypothetical protein